MKQFYVFLMSLFFCGISNGLTAQVTCTNKLLAELVGQLPDMRLDEGFKGEFMVHNVSNVKPVVVERNSEGTISHVGIKFFERDIIQKHPSPIYHFVERYFLELMLLSSQDEIATKMRLEHVEIKSEVYSLKS